jgi:hypothetical protein
MKNKTIIIALSVLIVNATFSEESEKYPDSPIFEKGYYLTRAPLSGKTPEEAELESKNQFKVNPGALVKKNVDKEHSKNHHPPVPEKGTKARELVERVFSKKPVSPPIKKRSIRARAFEVNPGKGLINRWNASGLPPQMVAVDKEGTRVLQIENPYESNSSLFTDSISVEAETLVEVKVRASGAFYLKVIEKDTEQKEGIHDLNKFVHPTMQEITYTFKTGKNTNTVSLILELSGKTDVEIEEITVEEIIFNKGY